MRGDELGDHHAFNLILWSYPDHRHRGAHRLDLARLGVAMRRPQGAADLIVEDVIEVVGHAPANRLQVALGGGGVEDDAFLVIGSGAFLFCHGDCSNGDMGSFNTNGTLTAGRCY
ncbi:hypothetical protein [Methylocystis echinoides]|uniref:hypothetical protein n=1 Tax=Methylocystis echinoides TaxID=29468 RepID=UPI0024934EB1|nr:hypothetical protein [Methylocystis echinoides]